MYSFIKVKKNQKCDQLKKKPAKTGKWKSNNSSNNNNNNNNNNSKNTTTNKKKKKKKRKEIQKYRGTLRSKVVRSY